MVVGLRCSKFNDEVKGEQSMTMHRSVHRHWLCSCAASIMLPIHEPYEQPVFKIKGRGSFLLAEPCFKVILKVFLR